MLGWVLGVPSSTWSIATRCASCSAHSNRRTQASRRVASAFGKAVRRLRRRRPIISTSGRSAAVGSAASVGVKAPPSHCCIQGLKLDKAP